MLVLGSQCSLSVKGQSSCWAPGEKRDGCGSMQVSGTVFLWSGVEGKSRNQKGVVISPRCLNPCLGLGWDGKTPLLALGLWIYGYLAILVILESLIPVHKNPEMGVEHQLCLEGICLFRLFTHLWQTSDTFHWGIQISWRLSLNYELRSNFIRKPPLSSWHTWQR